ncbi:TolB family protein [Cyclobacterium xiamenense]|uniref:TolB family protein n=1 Tax=Cyclobacterium xiamenense TaxID=1297121 RepID=UPI0012B8F78E|nr:PD40 domain-containing protein [Cyclobacterium xiamenense]
MKQNRLFHPTSGPASFRGLISKKFRSAFVQNPVLTTWVTGFFRLNIFYTGIFFSLLALIFACQPTEAPDPDVDEEEPIEEEVPANNLSTGFLVTGDMRDNKLPINGVATFRLNVVGHEGDLDELQYRWTLTEERARMQDAGTGLTNPTVAGRVMNCVGMREGEETITVEILDAEGKVLAERSADFDIAGFIDPDLARGCFDQPKIIYHYEIATYVMNFDGSGRESIYNSGNLPAVDISPNGEWIAYQKDFDRINGDSVNYTGMVLRRCSSIEEILIPSDGTRWPGQTWQTLYDTGRPRFSKDSKTVYFMRFNPAQGYDTSKPGVVGVGNEYKYRDLAAYDIESGTWRYLTEHWKEESQVIDFVVSPATGEIIYSYAKTGEFERLRFLNPETGAARDFIDMSAQGIFVDQPAISPDGKDLIFISGTQTTAGIYRLELVDGAQPMELYRFDPQYTGFGYPHYYAGGTRIMMNGYQDQDNSNLWSIDANGNDLQMVTDTPGDELMIGVLH